jgi:5'-3' exonuclease
MGITNFIPFLKSNYPSSIKEEWLDSYDNLYIDLNHALHHIVYECENTIDIVTKLKYYLFQIINRSKPKKRIFIIADGPAPLAKLIEQRKRRLNKSKNDITINLSAGTEFMSQLENSMSDLKDFLEKILCIEIIFDIINEGEGEIKIKKYLKKQIKSYPSEKQIVYSGDSDTILILFNTNKNKNIYQIINKNTIISIGKLFSLHKKLVSYKIKNDTIIKYDFVFLNMLFGNDYLPKISNIKIENIWKIYHLIDENGIINYTDKKYIINLENFKIIAKEGQKLNKINKKIYYDSLSCSNYLNGLIWCLNMYKIGKCKDYQFIYNYETPHIEGLICELEKQNEYTITNKKSIDFKLYGILLIPKSSNALLSQEQLLLSEQLEESCPEIYEEELCKLCHNYKHKIQILKNKKKFIKNNISESYYLENKQNIQEVLNDDLYDNDYNLENSDFDNIFFDELLEDICVNEKFFDKKYKKHKKTHTKICPDVISNIKSCYHNLIK